MRKITGELLASCREEEKKVRALLRKELPSTYFHNRSIEWEYCNSYSYSGATLMTSKQAVIRLSTKYIQPDFDTMRHELLHALLPSREAHGEIFQKGMDILNRNGLQVSRFASAMELVAKPRAKYRYRYTIKENGKSCIREQMRKTKFLNILINYYNGVYEDEECKIEIL